MLVKKYDLEHLSMLGRRTAHMTETFDVDFLNIGEEGHVLQWLYSFQRPCSTFSLQRYSVRSG